MRGYDGTCLRAANFLRVGETTGRGRQDREKRRGKTVKTVFLYETGPELAAEAWGFVGQPCAGFWKPGEGLNAVDWAEKRVLEEHPWATSACRRVW